MYQFIFFIFGLSNIWNLQHADQLQQEYLVSIGESSTKHCKDNLGASEG